MLYKYMVIPNNDTNFWDLMVQACPVQVQPTNNDHIFKVEDLPVQSTPLAPETPEQNVPQVNVNDLLARIEELENKLKETSTTEE